MRSSAARGYLYPAMDRANLTIETDALAGRIVTDAGRATAVDYRQRGQARSARAKRRIIVAPVPITPRSCCCSPGSARRTNCGPSASIRSWTCPAWAATCTTTPTS